jgi:hypothetical protein
MMTAADVARALAERLEALVRELLPDGRREGHEWLVGNAHGERGSSLGVHLSGPKRASGVILPPAKAAMRSIWSKPCLALRWARR